MLKGGFKMRYLIKFLLIAQLLILPALFSAEVWEGYVSLTKDYTVANGETLVIMPGTVVRFASGFGLIVDGGTLLAEGTESKMITFTSFEPESSGNDDWGGISFYNANKDTSRVSWCEIENIDRKDGLGSIFMGNSCVNITDSYIHDNISENGGGIQIDNSVVNIGRNSIEKNTAMYYGGGIYILHTKGDFFPETYIYKNLIKDNTVALAKDGLYGGGGISIFEGEAIGSFTQLLENDIIANITLDEGRSSGSGGGIFMTTRAKYEVDISGNRIMYNLSFFGGGAKIWHDTADGISPVIFSNNIVANNTSDDQAGGVIYDTGQAKKPVPVKFENNNIVNNHNLNAKTGSGGLHIIFDGEQGNFFPVSNSIFWNNYRSTTLSDITSNPYTSPGNIVRYCNFQTNIEGVGIIHSNSLFQREVTNFGALPYEHYLKGDYHLSLESPCVDAGDPESESLEPDKTRVNIGAYGNTNEATTSIFELIEFIKPIEEIYVRQGQTIKLDCRNYKETVDIGNLTVEDGGHIYLASKPADPNIYIKNLVTQGVKIGERYTTRIQRMSTAEGSELTFNILNIENMNCTGAQFSNMAVNVTSNNTATLNDSHVYLYDYDMNLEGVSVDAPEANITNNIVHNFGIGIYIGSPTKTAKASKGRIANNTISFEPTPSRKLNEVAKGVLAENTEADIEGNTVVNPNEGVETKSSSGRISNNTEPTASKKAAGPKRAIYITGGSSYEVDHNNIFCDDANSTDIRAIEVDASAINCHYNIVRFGIYDDYAYDRYGFYAYKLLPFPGSELPTFINNTIYNSDLGFYGSGTNSGIKLFNNIFYGPSVNTYITSDIRNLVLFNNDIVGEVNSGAVDQEKDNISQDPYFQSSTVSDFYLWGESNCINSGYYDPDYHEFGVNFYGSAPDMGAVEYYERTTLSSPSNVQTSISGTILTISWNSVDYANSYKIYGSDLPYSGFTYIKSTALTSWPASTSSSKKFYRIIASTDPAKENEYPETDQRINPEQKKLEIKSRQSQK
jgi:hypothetical protein